MHVTDLGDTWCEGVQVDLSQGRAWVLYSDDGPGGPCGQSMHITCPHSVLVTFANEDAMRAWMETQTWRNAKHRIMYGVVGEWTAGGVFRVLQPPSTNRE